MSEVHELTDSDRIEMLRYPSGKIDIVLDTDAFNEVDDQFAIAYAFLSPEKINVKAVYAAPFYNARSESAKDGMEKSYDEIFNILGFLDVGGKDMVFKGSEAFLDNNRQPIKSPAADDLIKRAMQYSKECPLYVVAIGAITNIASAILIQPAIIDKIVVVWLGGHAHHLPHTREFNMQGDVYAAQVVFDSGIALVQLPCMGVVSELFTTAQEMKEKLHGKSELGTYLADIVAKFIESMHGDRKVIWDISAVAWLIHPDWVKTETVPCPTITDSLTYEFDDSRHIIKVASKVARDEIFVDLFNKIACLK